MKANLILTSILVAGTAAGQSRPARGVEGEDRPVVRSLSTSSESALHTAVLLRDGERARRVSAKRVFRDGERFQLAVRSEQDGYLYVVCQSSRGEAHVLFPNARMDPGDNQIGGETQTLPQRGSYRFDDQPGREVIYVFVSSEQVDVLDGAVASGGELAAASLRRLVNQSPASSTLRRRQPMKDVQPEEDIPLLVQRVVLIHEPRGD